MYFMFRYILSYSVQLYGYIVLCSSMLYYTKYKTHVCLHVYVYIYIYIYMYGQASGVPRSPPPNGMVWYGVGGGGLACAERGGGRWSCSWRNGQASQTRPA